MKKARVTSAPDNPPIVVMDAQCGLCSLSARLIHRLDRTGDIRIAPMQSPLGQTLLARSGLDPADPSSWLFIADGQASTSMAAVIRIGRRLGGWGHLVHLLRPMPVRWQDGIYRWIARNRYHLFGRASLCDLTDPALQRRLVK